MLGHLRTVLLICWSIIGPVDTSGPLSIRIGNGAAFIEDVNNPNKADAGEGVNPVRKTPWELFAHVDYCGRR
jgi:hypothetical protein